MRCAWQSFIELLPPWMRYESDIHGKDRAQELRIRLNQPPELVLENSSRFLQRDATGEDISFVLNAASRYSPWTSATAAKGYLSAQGGHRIGICGQAIVKGGCLEGIRNPTSLCIRIARDYPGIAQSVPMQGSVLIVGSPGSGKTTFLRDLIRSRARLGKGSIAVVDERGELFPYAGGLSCFSTGNGTDVLTGVSKAEGIDILLRTMGPVCIAVDEITKQEDAEALIRAAWCGVDLYATAHAGSKRDLLNRPVYRKIAESCIFDRLIVMDHDKSWRMERMNNKC
ncbi:MAG: Flp pilus assembly complex ATPase component TadA [Oscillospiraceae bacterium]|nr:Flp pilus assembly complex ATPase component TadA [Oscillospiraceae bacterium]